MTDEQAKAFISNRGDNDDYLLCEAAVQLGSDWVTEAKKFLSHIEWVTATGGYPDKY